MFLNARHPNCSVLALSFLVLATLASSCGKKAPTQEAPTQREAVEAKPPAMAEPAPAAVTTDANIVAILLTANQVALDNAKLALRRTTDQSVQAFANQIVADQVSAIRQVTELATRAGFQPLDNDASRQIAENSKAIRRAIGESKGAAFDRAYIENEVTFQQTMLDLLDRTLIPGATSPELKSLLTSMRPTFEGHLEHAKHVQAALPS